MHELALCKNILKIIEAYNSLKDNKRIQSVNLEVGMLAAVEQSSLIFNFDILKKHTIAENATLHIFDIPGEAFCDSCQIHVKINQLHEPCPQCSGYFLTITKGLELRVQSLEIA